jgi:hypothetical protein
MDAGGHPERGLGKKDQAPDDGGGFLVGIPGHSGLMVFSLSLVESLDQRYPWRFDTALTDHNFLNTAVWTMEHSSEAFLAGPAR